MKFEAEGREFSKFLRSLEHLMQTVKSEQFLVTECFFNLFLKVSQISKNRKNRIQIGKKILGFRNMQDKLEKVIFCLLELTSKINGTLVRHSALLP